MTWEEIINGKEITWSDIHLKHGNARQLFNAMRDQAKQAIDKEHYRKLKKFRNFAELPEHLKNEFANDREKWLKEWGNNSKELMKLEKAYEQDMNAHLERLHKYETMNDFPENKQDILKALEREALIQEIKNARERFQSSEIDRSF